MRHNEDQGTAFGTWPDATSRLMYQDIMPLALSGIDTSGRVADFGGANGLLKQWIPHAVSVDYDASKNPDVCESVLDHAGDYELVVMRYLLHYMPDSVVRTLFKRMGMWHNGRVLLIQFVNENLEDKRANSWGEIKHFRTEAQLMRLLSPFGIISRKAVEYRVEADFYRNRLQHPAPFSHDETVVIYEMVAP